MQVQDIINGALRLIGVIAAGEGGSPEELADGFISLQEMLGEWQTDGLMIYATRKDLLNLSNGTQTYTVGVGGTFNIPRPVAIKSAAIITGAGGFSIPLQLIGPDDWTRLTEKSITGQVPLKMYNDWQYPLSNFSFWPIPGSPTPQLDMYSWFPLNTFVALTDTFDMPPGYEMAIRANLGIFMAPEYGRPVSQETMLAATDAKSKLGNLNRPPIPGVAEMAEAAVDPRLLQGGAPGLGQAVPRAA